MSSPPLVRVRVRVWATLLIAMTLASGAAAALACGGEQASAVPAGGPVVVPSAHASPDPRPAIPLSLTKEDAGDAAAADRDSGP